MLKACAPPAGLRGARGYDGSIELRRRGGAATRELFGGCGINHPNAAVAVDPFSINQQLARIHRALPSIFGRGRSVRRMAENEVARPLRDRDHSRMVAACGIEGRRRATMLRLVSPSPRGDIIADQELTLTLSSSGCATGDDAPSRSPLLKHDLFRKTGFHFSGSCCSGNEQRDYCRPGYFTRLS